MMRRAVVLGATALLVALSSFFCRAVRAEEPDSHAARRTLAARYEMHGLVENAVAEYLKILVGDPGDSQARERIVALVSLQMPAWLPEEAEGAFPFPHEVVEFGTGGEGDGAGVEEYDRPGVKYLGGGPAEAGSGDAGGAVGCRALVTAGGFSARERERWDDLHEKRFARIDYAYVWQAPKQRYEVRVAAHWEADEQTEVAQRALWATLALYCLARGRLGLDPTGRWGDPVDVWVMARGEPGARAQGRSIYLYAVKTERSPGEWLREIAHEYGHVALPGVGGFTETDDPWADGHLGELLFAKWLAGGEAPEWMPWSVEEWEGQAREERARLMKLWSREETEGLWQEQAHFGSAQRRPAERDNSGGGREAHLGVAQRGPADEVLGGVDEAARDRFLGLALWVEEKMGPEFLGEALGHCRRGSARQFAAAVEKVARERRVEVWGAAEGHQVGEP